METVITVAAIMNGSPSVSICIPTRDHAALLPDAIRSACGQRHPSLEILVLDNASTDETPAIAARAAAADPRLRYVRHEQDLGMAGNFNAGVSMSRGEFVQILCDDDVLEDGAAALLAQALASEPQAVLAAGGRIFADAALRPGRVVRPRSKRECVDGSALMRECFAYGNRIGEPSAVMFRRAFAARGFSDAYSQLVDLEMWFHLLAFGPAVLMPEGLCRVRQHADQMTEQNIRSARLLEDKRRLFHQFALVLSSKLTRLQKLAWDCRMASSVARIRRVGGSACPLPSAEVFHPSLFRLLLIPAIATGWHLLRAG
jgi:hypothetical protein